MPKVTIDGKEIEVAKGTRVIEAAKQAGIDIPFYCYHPGLSVAGNCRMCLVEIEKMPKLQISCHIECTDGMVVHTQNQKVTDTRKHVLEFLLVNHPLDCPICDQAGECWLQDYYLNYGAYESRVNENKVRKPKAQTIGPNVMLDAERCILCSRCVRFTDEVSKTSELGIINRGDHSEITLFPGKELNNPYSGNVVDICPVGALTDRDFRFKLRVWYLEAQDSICTGCSRGCNIQIQYRSGRPHHARGERVMRLKPRYNENVNKWWMCDEGRYGYKFHDQNRIARPIKRSGHEIKEMEWDEILPDLAKKFESAKGKVGILLSPQLSNEDLYLALKIFKEKLKLKSIFLVKPNTDGFKDEILIKADKNPNSKGAELLGLSYQPKEFEEFLSSCEKGEVEGLVILGQDLLTLYGKKAEAALSKTKWSVFIGPNHHVTSEFAAYALPSATHAEKFGTFANFEGRVQMFKRVFQPLGEARPEWKILLQLAGLMGISFSFDREEDIFNEMALALAAFKDLSYEKLGTGGSDIRVFSAPMIPKLTQDSGLIFYHEKQTAEPAPPAAKPS